VRIARIFGIDIEADWSWVLALLLFTWAFSGADSPFIRLDPGMRVAIAFACSVLLFVSVLIHEFAHAAVARRYHLAVNGVHLFIFGGVARIAGSMASEGQEAMIAAAGPLSTLVVAAFSLLCALLVSSEAVHELFVYLTYANIALALFNMLPAYPLDGGRVAHAISWGISGSRERATEVTIGVSRVFGIAFILGGALLAASGNLVSGVTIVFVGWFVIAAARGEWLRAAVLGRLGHVTAGQIADPPLLVLPPNATCEEARAAMAARRAQCAPVTLGNRLLGTVSIDDLERANDPQGYVGSVMTRTEDLGAISSELPVPQAIDRLSSSGRRELAVVSGDELAGFISQATLSRLLAYERKHRS
jgi:Zn-dependent protease/CBS domain-containing protein